MNLLSSLLEGSSNFQASSLLFCESPKDQISLKDLTDTKIPSKQTEGSSRSVSKSLTKMGFYSPNPKIDPKERLLHRIGYNLQMKCRKHYYNFFVKLQNICKKSPPPPIKKVEDKQRQRMMSFFERMNQIQTILFFKYFQGQIKKSAFKTIKQNGSFKKGLQVVCSKFTQIKKEQSFIVIYNYSKKIEKEEMRIEILATSVHHVINSWKIDEKKQILGEVWSLLYKRYKNQRQTEQQKIISAISEKLQKDKVIHIKESKNISQADEIYKAMKNRVNSRNKSPCKAATKIDLNLGKTGQVNSVQQPNFLKAYSIHTSLTQQPFKTHFSQESRYKIIKRSDSDPLNSRQLNDLYDKNILFFPFQVQDTKLITQSSVHEVNFSDHTYSQATLIHPLKEVFEGNRMSLITKNQKTNTFGSDAVSFKNSLVSERQSYKMQEFLGNIEDRREASFLKAKNFIKQSRQVQDDSAPRNDAKIKVNNRYESAEKSYFSKLRPESKVSNFGPFPDTLPLSLNLISSQYHTAEPDYGKGPLTGRTSQAESTSSRDAEGYRRPSFIKITKKL